MSALVSLWDFLGIEDTPPSWLVIAFMAVWGYLFVKIVWAAHSALVRIFG